MYVLFTAALMPVLLQGYVGTAGTALFYTSVFLSSQLTGILQHAVGMPGMFLVFSALASFYLMLVFMLVPETSGKTYQQFVEEAEIDYKI